MNINHLFKMVRGSVQKYLLFTSPFLAIFIFYIACMSHIRPSEVGIARNELSGELWLQPPGYHITPPWVLVARADTRPTRVAVTSAGKGYSSKLVRFKPEFYREFIATEGFRYYWWANRLSFNFGYKEEYRGWIDILRGYAYSPRHYPFLETIDEYEGR
jgi:hypothetical protein